MSTKFDFIIDRNNKITVTVPDIPSKINYYYEPTEKLNQFDEATVYFNINGHKENAPSKNKIILKQDTIDYTIFRFYELLQEAVSNHLALANNTIMPGNLGAELNKMLNRTSKFDIRPFWVWSCLNNTDTLLYNYNNKIFLEIVPTCPDLFTNKATQIVDKLFKRFMKTYKPYFVAQISHKKAQAWLKQCEEILIAMGYTKEKL
jgi:hypothetical protein